MRVLLTSAGLETEEIEQYFVKMIGKDMKIEVISELTGLSKNEIIKIKKY